MEKEGKVTKVCCILNPISGKGRSAKAVYGPDSFIGTGTLIYPTQSFKDAMAEINPDIEFVIKETERRGHAVELAEEYANQGYAKAKRDELHKLAEANRSSAYYRWW